MSYINKDMENGKPSATNLEMKSMGNIVNQNRFDINDISVPGILIEF